MKNNHIQNICIFIVCFAWASCNSKSNNQENMDLDNVNLENIAKKTKAFDVKQLDIQADQSNRYIVMRFFNKDGNIQIDSTQIRTESGNYTSQKNKRNSTKVSFTDASGKELFADYYENLFTVRVCEGPDPPGLVENKMGWFEVYSPLNNNIHTISFFEGEKMIQQVPIAEWMRKRQIKLK